MARDKLITVRIEGEKREAFNQLAKSQNTDTASLLYDFISGCLDGRIDISLVTGKGNRLDKIDNRIDSERIDKLETDTQRIDNRLDTISKRLDDWIEAIDDRLTDCDQGLSEKIITLEHRINALSSQLDSQKDSQKIDTDSQKNDDMEYLLKREREASIATSPLPPSPPGTDAIASIDGTVTGAIETAIKPTIGDEPAIEVPSAKRKGLTDSELARHLGIDKSNITRWKQRGKPTPKYKDWELIGRLWYEIN
jgi:uncharacterized phage infection (PIP) family protein YhgE